MQSMGWGFEICQMTSQYDVKCQQKTRGGFPLIDFTKNRKPMCKGVHPDIHTLIFSRFPFDLKLFGAGS